MITTQTVSRIAKVLSYIHATLFLVMITPLLYGIGEVTVKNTTVIVTIKCFLIIIPVIVTEKAERLSKNLAVYMLVCIAMTGVVFEYTYIFFRPFSAYDYCYAIVMVAETILLAITRMADRLKKVDDFLSAKEPSIFDKPRVVYAWYFVVMYMLGILFNSKILCDISFGATIFYLFTSFCYEYLTGTNNYLYINNRTKGIPKKRLYGISTAMALIFLLICFVGILPSIFMSGFRKYTDIRHWMDDMPPIEIEYDEGEYMSQSQDNAMMALMQEGEAGEPSKLLSALFWGLGVGCALLFIYGFVQMIRQIFKDFRNTLDENGDIIEEIKDDEAAYKESELYIRGNHIDSEALRIRRRYKKAIKKHRKDMPAPYESPDEIEENAGLINNEEMRQLHGEYENARYGR